MLKTHTSVELNFMSSRLKLNPDLIINMLSADHALKILNPATGKGLLVQGYLAQLLQFIFWSQAPKYTVQEIIQATYPKLLRNKSLLTDLKEDLAYLTRSSILLVVNEKRD